MFNLKVAENWNDVVDDLLDDGVEKGMAIIDLNAGPIVRWQALTDLHTVPIEKLVALRDAYETAMSAADSEAADLTEHIRVHWTSELESKYPGASERR